MCEEFAGPLTIVADSTYVVNCWRDRWWEGWLRKDWKNSQRKPVANRDLWEQLVPHFRDRSELELRWVKGHSGDRWNDVADRLAVAAVERRAGASGGSTPGEGDLGEEDVPGAAHAHVEERRAADGRVPEGFLMVVAGQRSGRLAASEAGAVVRAELERVIGGWAEMHDDLVVLTGLRAGAEELGAAAAAAAGVPYVVVLPYPDPTAGWPERERARFQAACAAARSVVTLEKQRPADVEGRRKALTRRDGWLRKVSDAAIVLTDGHYPEAEVALHRFEQALGESVWRLDLPG